MPRAAARVVPRPAPSVVPRPLTGESNPPSHQTGEELDAILAAKRRANRAAAPAGEPARWAGRFQRTTLAGSPRRPPREPVAGIALGAGWGCAELEGAGQRSRACWLAPSAAERDRGTPLVRANRVPYIPPSNTGRAEGKGRQASEVAPRFACALEGGELVCQGSDPFAVVARTPVKGSEVVGWPHPLALGHHHGCVRQELDIACWGRGDHGELGFPASDRCKDGASEVACSRRLRLARVQGERRSHPPLLVAGDTYTCAVTANFVECWGVSRDGFFPSPGPARVPGLRLNGVNSLSAGPRGLCGDDDDGGSRCAGAIPAPPVGVTSVVVSQGNDASACGVDADGIVCWGEAYSPRGRPSDPVRVRVDQAFDPAAPVVDSPGRWDAECRIERPCTRDWTKPPRCESPLGSVPWASLAPRAAAQRGQLVSVTGNFVVGPVGMTLAGCARGMPWDHVVESPNAPKLCCNGAFARLGLISDGFALQLEHMECQGDESRLCCTAPATGQPIIATGTLDWDDDITPPGWLLRDPKLCSPE